MRRESETLDRSRLTMEPLSARRHRASIESTAVAPDSPPGDLTDTAQQYVGELVERIRAARLNDRPVMCAFGAHAIKNGLGPVLAELIERDWLTHLATNGAGIIHDWEFSYCGRSGEDVARLVTEGRFGNWQETGFFINLALNVGAYEGKGYGQSVGAMICGGGLDIPSETELEKAVSAHLAGEPECAAAADLLGVVREFEIAPGRMDIEHAWRQYSIQGEAFRLGVPCTGHPMIGSDIIYNHPMNRCACLGRCAERDFLAFANSVSHLNGGVYISIGSAVMSPMIFEKSLSMAQNLARQEGRHIDDHFIAVVDIAPSTWDWSAGEPPDDDPAYYLRYNKTFSRMGGDMRYVQADNRDFLLTLVQQLGS